MRRSRSQATPSTVERVTRLTEEGVFVTSAAWAANLPVVKFLNNGPEAREKGYDIMSHVLTILNMCKKEKVMIAAYTFDHNLVAKALIDAVSERQCSVQILADQGQMYEGRSTSQGLIIETMMNRGVEVRTYRPQKGGCNACFHMKSMTIENALVLSGSANWTYNSMELCAEASTLTRAHEAVSDAVTTFKYYWAMSAQVDVTRLKEPTDFSRNRNRKFLDAYGQDRSNVASSGGGQSGVAYPLQGGFAAAAELQRSSRAVKHHTTALNLDPSNAARTPKAAVEAKEDVMVPLRGPQKKKTLNPISKAAMAMQRFSPPSRVTGVQRLSGEEQSRSSLGETGSASSGHDQSGAAGPSPDGGAARAQTASVYTASLFDPPYEPSDPRDVDSWMPSLF